MLFFATRTAFFIQDKLSIFTWYLLIAWIFPLIKNKPISGEEKEYETPTGSKSIFTHTFDHESKLHRILHRYFNKAMAFQAWLAGLKRVEDVYAELLNFDNRFRLLGYLQPDTSQSIEIQGRKFKQGEQEYRGWDLMWLSRPKPSGTIAILSKELIGKKEESDGRNSEPVDYEGKIRIHAVWLSGERAGNCFSVDPDHASRVIEMFHSRDYSTMSPSHVYIPSGPIINTIQFVVGSGAIVAALTPWFDLFEKASSHIMRLISWISSITW